MRSAGDPSRARAVRSASMGTWGRARMSGDLVSMRILLVSASDRDRDALRHAAASATVPIDVLDAISMAAARPLLAREIDVVFLDAAIAEPERSAFIADARAVRPQPFVLLVAPNKDAGDEPHRRRRRRCAGQARERRGRPQRWSSAAFGCDCPNACWSSTIRRPCAASCARSSPPARFRLDIGEAEEGIDALKQIASGKFDLVFLDYNMPGLNGVRRCPRSSASIRSSPWC